MRPMGCILDTYAWIEYFDGSEMGKKIKNKIENDDNNMTPTVVLAEMKKRYTDWGRSDFEDKLEFIRSKSIIEPLNERIAVEAGYIRSTGTVTGMGIVDCVLLALSRLSRMKVLTGDEHFKDLQEADYFGD